MNTGPKIYFQDVNRIHVNRFKAYTQILSKRMNDRWQITDNISEANAVATYQESDDDNSVICLSLYSAAPNLNPPVLDQLKFKFDEASLIKKLNQAGRKLKLAKNKVSSVNNSSKSKEIKIASYQKYMTESLCQILNDVNDKEYPVQFINHTEKLINEPNKHHEQLLFVVDPKESISVDSFFSLENNKKEGVITINDLTVVVINHKNDPESEAMFDQIYDHCDDSTQLTLLDLTQSNDLKDFIRYFA